MYRMFKSDGKRIFMILVMLSFAQVIFAQSGFGSSASGFSFPEPYEDSEFSSGLRDIRRFEQVFFGSFPLAVFFAQMLGGLGILIQDIHYNKGDGWNPAKSFDKLGVENYRYDDKVRILTAGIGISFGIAVADMIIYQSRKKKESERYKRRRSLQGTEEKDEPIDISSIPPLRAPAPAS